MRRNDWFSELCGAITRSAKLPFSYGKHDCCLFAARCVDAMRGTNYAQQLARAYSDVASGRRFLARFRGYEEAISSFLGKPSAGRARTGDVCLFRQGTGHETCGIVLGPFIVGAGKDGVAVVLRRRILARWSI
jgi:hypothetical protein